MAPDFTRTVNVYDSQGGSQPVTFSFIKTAANTWAYEASYAGNAANTDRRPARSRHGTDRVQLRRHAGQCRTARSPASGNVALTIPWKLATSGLNPQTISLSLGTVGGSNGLTQADAPSVLNGTNIDGTPYGSVTGVTIDKDGTVTAQFSNGLSQDVYKIPIATFTNPNGLGQMSGNAYAVTKRAARRTSTLPIRAPRGPSSPNPWKLRPSISRPSSPI